MTQVATNYGSGLPNARQHTSTEPLTGSLTDLTPETAAKLVHGFSTRILQRMAYSSIAHIITSNHLQEDWNQVQVFGADAFGTGLEIQQRLPSRIQGPNTGLRTSAATPRVTQTQRWVTYRMGEARNYLFKRDLVFNSFVKYIPYAAGGLQEMFLTNDMFSEMGLELGLDVEASVLDELHDSEHIIGTAGTAVSTSNYSWVKDVITTLSKNEVSLISSSTMWQAGTEGWQWIMDEDVYQSVTDYIDTRRLESTDGLDGITDDGKQYMLRGIPIVVTPRVPRQGTGTRQATGAINGTRPANLHPGNASSFIIDGLGSNATILRGESFTVDGVHHASPSTRASTGVLKKFVVAADTQASAGGEATVTFYGEANDGNMYENNDGTGGDYSPWQNITAYPSDNATVRFDGAPSSNIRQCFLVQKDAIDLSYTQLHTPWSSDQNTGSFTVEGVPGSINIFNSKFDIHNLEEDAKFLTCFGANMVDRRRCVRVLFDYVT